MATSRSAQAQAAADEPSEVQDLGEVRDAIRMTADRVLVVPSKELGERRSRSGILIPATAAVNRRLGWAEVVAVGPTVRNVAEGDLVLFAPDTGFEVDLRGDEYIILRERDVQAVASKRDEGQTGLYL
jgi:chaperonin GroES